MSAADADGAPPVVGGAALAPVAALAVVLVALVAAALALPSGDEADAAPVPPVGRFVVECPYSHSAPDDPIVAPGFPGQSHQHDFFGNVAVDAFSTPEQLSAADTTCVVQQDRAAYWAPALLRGDDPIRPVASDAYYRAGPGVEPTEVVPFPFGFVAIGGDAGAETAQSTNVVGWACGRNSLLSVDPPTCPESKPLALHVRFPACWDGERLDSLDHRNHVVYGGETGGCPDTHPVHVPQLELVVQYDLWGDPTGLRLASGSVRTCHADFMNAWDPDKLATDVAHCIGRGVVCGSPSI